MERIAIVGATRGLGAELCRILPPETRILAIGRKADRLAALRDEIGAALEPLAADLTKDISDILNRIEQFQPTRVFYLAGGGPFGNFESKAWKDHQWAWEVTFVGAARVVHAALQYPLRPQVVLCGSSVAESSGDAKAASYASAKHAILGLYRSLRLENPAFDIRLFSPGYLDTELLPKGAEVRYKGVWSPQVVAKELWKWSYAEKHGAHLRQDLHPS